MPPSKLAQQRPIVARSHRLPGSAAACIAILAAAWIGHGCLVDEKCFEAKDCQLPKVCGANGTCELQCLTDADCDSTYGFEYVCQKNKCIKPIECTLCVFPHAESTCIHGICQRGSCNSGYHDVNGIADDGCEYECSASGAEICDYVDNDCDGKLDEETDIATLVEHCGSCNNACPTPPNADAVCGFGQCLYACHDGFYDNNARQDDGCEGTACVPKEEICDGRDNDCNCTEDSNRDGEFCGPGDNGVDEGFDKTLATSCGAFCSICSYEHAVAHCVDGACEMGACESGWHDMNGIALDGCEYPCTPGGDEECDSIDNDCDGRVDEGEVCQSSCPSDMVNVGFAYCVDRYEASRRDATATDQGQDGSVALSRPGVMPWMVNPISRTHLAEFEAACAAAGKRLCSKEEWFASCTGPGQTAFVYGDVFDRETCNCVDSFCDDHCAEQSIEATSCEVTADCGYQYDCFKAVPTGQFKDCTNEYGTFDINGNVWEIVPSTTDSRGYEIRGGAFNCASARTRVNCSYNADWTALYAGFRCCKELQ